MSFGVSPEDEARRRARKDAQVELDRKMADPSYGAMSHVEEAMRNLPGALGGAKKDYLRGRDYPLNGGIIARSVRSVTVPYIETGLRPRIESAYPGLEFSFSTMSSHVDGIVTLFITIHKFPRT